MQLFYHPDLRTQSKEVVFTADESRHIAKVLRHVVGDILHVTNGIGFWFEIELTHVSPKNCIGHILRSEQKPALPYTLEMAVAPTKQNDRYEWFLEKATEIGIDAIHPISCEHSERKVIKQERMERIIESAVKQSLSAYVPKLYSLQTFTDFLETAQNFKGIKYIAHCNSQELPHFKSVVKAGVPVLVLVGPEGDFSEKEVSIALSHGFQEVSLGERRLRTETAAIYACALVSYVNER